MIPAASFAHIVSRFGQSVALYRREGEVLLPAGEGKAFVQPVTGQRSAQQDDLESALGTIYNGRYLYLGPASLNIACAKDGCLATGGMTFQVKRFDRVRLQDEDFYIWALLARTEEVLP